MSAPQMVDLKAELRWMDSVSHCKSCGGPTYRHRGWCSFCWPGKAPEPLCGKCQTVLGVQTAFATLYPEEARRR